MELRLVLCLALWTCANGSPANPAVLEPTTVSDSAGNVADDNSTITWAGIPTGGAYQTSTEYDDGGIGALFNFARSFVHTVQPNDIPYGEFRSTFDFDVNREIGPMQ